MTKLFKFLYKAKDYNYDHDEVSEINNLLKMICKLIYMKNYLFY